MPRALHRLPPTRAPLAMELLKVACGDAFWRRVQGYPVGAVVRHADATGQRHLMIVSGWACEVRLTPTGVPVICSLLLPGDVAHVALLGPHHTVAALTVLEAVDCDALVEAAGGSAEPARRAIEQSLEARELRLHEQIMRVGRLTGRERTANLLLELHDRLEAVGRTREGSFEIPLTRAFLAAYLGLSLAHLKRVLLQLRREGLIHLARDVVVLRDRETLAAIAAYPTAMAVRRERPCFPPPPETTSALELAREGTGLERGPGG